MWYVSTQREGYKSRGSGRNFFQRPDAARTRLCACTSHARVLAPFPSPSSRAHTRESRACAPRAHVPVKTACESEKALSVQRYMRRKNSDSFLTREAAGVKTRLFSRATASRERCTVVDTVSMRARTPPHSLIRARARKCLLGDDAREESVSGACEPTTTRKSHGRANTLIDLVLSSSIDDTVNVFTESFVLRSSFFPT